MELLAVVMIIGILSSVALPQYRKVVEKSRFTKAQVMAKAMYDSCVRQISEWGVDYYTDLPSDVQTVYRLDIGSEDLLPAGFTINSSKTITGSGFQYTLTDDCGVSIKKIQGTYANTTMNYNGQEFYNCTDDGSGACDIYGVD